MDYEQKREEALRVIQTTSRVLPFPPDKHQDKKQSVYDFFKTLFTPFFIIRYL